MAEAKPNQDLKEEQELAAYWQAKAKLKESYFDHLLKTRSSVLSISRKMTVADAKREIGDCIIHGRPLYRDEFFFAIGSYYLITNMSYLEFFTQRWHEAEDHMGYGNTEDCHLCKKEQEKAAAAAKNKPRPKKVSRRRQTSKGS